MDAQIRGTAKTVNKVKKSPATAKGKLEQFDKKLLAECFGWSYKGKSIFECREGCLQYALNCLSEKGEILIKDAFLSKRKGDYAPLEKLPKEGRDVVELLECYQKWFDSMATHYENFKRAVAALRNDYKKNPMLYTKEIPLVDWDDDDFASGVIDEFWDFQDQWYPEFAKKLWDALPKNERDRIEVGGFRVGPPLEQKLEFDPRWTDAEKDLIETDRQWRQWEMPFYDEIRNELGPLSRKLSPLLPR